MRRKFFMLILLVVPMITLNAQDYKTCLGLRAGVPVGLSVKHFVNETTAFEGILASRWDGFSVTGLYEKEKWTGEYPGLNWFWGFGAHVGTWSTGNNPYLENTYSGVVLGADGIIGLEYTFDPLPLNLSLDLLPSLNLIGATGWGGINGALSIRYVF